MHTREAPGFGGLHKIMNCWKLIKYKAYHTETAFE